jgi:hypothetical protein
VRISLKTEPFRKETQLTVVGQKREILTLGVTAWNSGHLRARGIDPGLLAQQVVGDVGVTDPDVHLPTDGGAEDTVVLVAKLLHGKPGGHWVDIVDASNVGDGAGRAWDELEPWGWLVSLGVLENLNSSD